MGIQRIQWRLHLWVLIGGALLIGTAVAAFYVLGTFVTPTSDDPPRKWDMIVLALTVAAGVGGLVALVVNYRKQLDLEEGRFSERFGAAAAQLGHPDVAVRIAGVYAMAGAADRTTRGQRQQCIDVLCGYLRLPYEPEIGSNHQTSKTTRRAFHNPAVPVEEETFQYRQNDREVRQTIVRVIASRLRRGSHTSWSRNDYDFTGALLEDANFNYARFKGGLTLFSDVTFSGERTAFAGASFGSQYTWFDQAKFRSNHTRFDQAKFRRKETRFDQATFSGIETRFDEAKFRSRDTSFSGAAFSSEKTSFTGAKFSSECTWFRHAKFSSKKTSFYYASFGSEYTGFEEARFRSDVTSFEQATFSGMETWFENATFSGIETRFEHATFSSEKTRFHHATFSSEFTSFEEANFSDGTTSFEGTLFSSDRTSFNNPRNWNPAPLFDWGDPESWVGRPANITPSDWPPKPVTTFDDHLPKHRFAAVIRRIQTWAAKWVNWIMWH